MRHDKLKDIDLSHRVTSIISPQRLGERRNKLELDEANAKLFDPHRKSGYDKERNLPVQLQEILYQPIYGIKELIYKNKDVFTDKSVRGQLLYQIDKATSLRDHLRNHADFYRRKRLLNNGTKYPIDPENDVTEHQFMRFWMSKLDYR